MRWIHVALGAALGLAGAAHADWVRVDSSTSGAVWYMDGGRIKTVGAHRQAWIKVDHSRDRTVAYRNSMELFSFNCDARTYRLLSFIDYDSMGKVVRSSSQPDYGEIGYEPVVPDSIGESAMKLACELVDAAGR